MHEPTANMPKTCIQQCIVIDALPSKVWKILTHQEYTRQFFLDDDFVFDWTEGGSILLKEEQKGKIEEIVPGVSLKFSLQQGSQTFMYSYDISPDVNGVELNMHCNGISGNDEQYFLRVQQLQLILQKIKWLAEYS